MTWAESTGGTCKPFRLIQTVAIFEPETPLGLDGLAERRLGDDLATRIARVKVREPHSGHTGKVSYRLAENLAFQVDLFNERSDRDKVHGIVGRVPRRISPKNFRWYPLIEIGKSGAWLKYTTTAGIRSSLKSGPDMPLGLKANEAVEHFYYHKHRRNKLLLTAVSGDLADLKSAFSLQDILSLDESQAVGIAASGRLRMSIEFRWSDLLASGMTRLAGLLSSSGPVAIDLPGDASVEFELDIRDAFRLVFLRGPDQSIRVAVRKSKADSVKAALNAGFDVKFARPSEIVRILDNAVSGLLGLSPDKFRSAVETLNDRISLERLSSPEKDLLESLVEHLGLDDEFEKVPDVLGALNDIEAKVTSTITEIARLRVAMSFAYDYSRMETDASIYEGDFKRSAMERLYPDLLAGRFQVLLADAKRHPGEIGTVRFLNEKSLVIRHSIGLSLGLGDWSVSGKESTVYRFLTQENSGKALRHSLLGSRRYVGKYFGPLESTFVEFRGDMPEFKPAGEVIGVQDFRFGLAVIYQDGKAWSRSSRLKSFLDTGLLCGIAPEGDLDGMVERVRSTFGKRKTLCKLTLRLDHSAVLGFCEWLAHSSAAELARAFAGAMDYQQKRPAVQMINGRRFLYSRFWQQALRSNWNDPYKASRYALQSLRPLDTSLYWSEKQSLRGRKKDPASVFMLFRRNPGLLDDFQTMRDACAGLHRAFLQNGPFEELKDIARDFHAFANTRFKTRVLGALINDWSVQHEKNTGEINSVIVIKADNGGQSLTIGR
jgi:hypothetical protein